MKVSVLMGADGKPRGQVHRVDAYNCRGRRHQEKTYGERQGERRYGRYVDIDVMDPKLPESMPVCTFSTCFPNGGTVGVIRTRMQVTDPRLLELVAWADMYRATPGRVLAKKIKERWRELEAEGVVDGPPPLD